MEKDNRYYNDIGDPLLFEGYTPEQVKIIREAEAEDRLKTLEDKIEFIMDNGSTKMPHKRKVKVGEDSYTEINSYNLQDLWDEQKGKDFTRCGTNGLGGTEGLTNGLGVGNKFCPHGFPYGSAGAYCSCKKSTVKEEINLTAQTAGTPGVYIEPTVKECSDDFCSCGGKPLYHPLYSANKEDKIEEIISAFEKDYFDLTTKIKLNEAGSIQILSWDKIKPWLRDKLKSL